MVSLDKPWGPMQSISLEYAVVKFDAPAVDEGPVFRGGAMPSADVGEGAGDEGTLSVEKVEASPHEISEIHSDDTVKAVAPIMPLRLVEPEASDAEASGEGSTWGIRAVGADTSPRTGKGIVVAVLDTGIDASHPAFADADVEVVEKDFTGEGDGDVHGHGTHCAGTIFGADVDGLRIGVAPGVDKALIGKVLGSSGGGTDAILAGINWAVAEGAKVISMSLGIDFPGMVEHLERRGVPDRAATSMALAAYRDNVRLFDTIADLARFSHSVGLGAVIVAASGNESHRQPTSGNTETYVLDAAPPATADGIVSVGALASVGDDAFDIAPFSNANPDLSGPGVDVISAAAGGGLKALSGTSMATPHVAGVAALWAQQLKEERALTVEHLQVTLMGKVHKTGLAFPDAGGGMVFAPQPPV